MTLTAGARIGQYEILAAVGAGGMGEVYRARDSKLGRDVALKILPDLFAGDPERLARFEREAQLLASLNHPHIAQIHGVEESNGFRALVLEFVDGATLADRLAHGAIPMADSLRIARQICDALEGAHAQGIVHRDLKPANIKVRDDGTVKVLDFGLAKALDPVGSSGAHAPDLSPTITSPAVMSHGGVIIGTAAYMAPEQARGKAVDKRADIWAFGCVLYEMLTGRRAFGGEELSDTLAAIIKSDPDWSLLPGATPVAIRRLLRRCLQKDRVECLADIADARLELNEAPGEPILADHSIEIVSLRRQRRAWIAALGLAVLAAAVALAFALRPPASPPEMRVEVHTSPTTDPTSFALAPDGLRIVFAASAPGGRQLWLRALSASEARPLPGTEGGHHPFWSPDSRSIGFFAGNKLKRTDVEGGTTLSLANVITAAGGTWNEDGTILYVPNSAGSIFRVAATGGDTTAIALRAGRGTRFPHFLPDGRHFLFYAGGTRESGVYVGELGELETRRLVAADGAAVFGAGHIWFVRQGTLVAQPFDPIKLKTTGVPVRVADDMVVGISSSVGVSVSAGGLIAYRPKAGQSRAQLVWFDRSGRQIETARLEGSPINPALSPDGRRVAVQMTTQQNTDVWLLDVERNVPTRLTFEPSIDALPVWSPDGRRLVFNSNRNDVGGLFVMSATGAGVEQLMLGRADQAVLASDWSSDGRIVLYRQIDTATGTFDIWALPLDVPRTPFPVVRTPYDERDGQLSPDGRWLAYQSNESGVPEIYVQAFPGRDAKVRISVGGGTQVRWRRDGRELFYIAGDNRLMAVSIDTATASEPRVRAAVPLFATRILGIGTIPRQNYVVSSDGQRFLINTVTDDANALPITLIVNWRGTR